LNSDVVNRVKGYQNIWHIRFKGVFLSYMCHKQEHLVAPELTSCFSGVRVTRSLVLCVCFVNRNLSFFSFFPWALCCLYFFDLRMIYMTVTINGAGTVCSSGVFEFTSSFSMILATQIVHFLPSWQYQMCARSSNSTHRTCNGSRTTISNGPHSTTQKMDNLSSKNHTKTGGDIFWLFFIFFILQISFCYWIFVWQILPWTCPLVVVIIPSFFPRSFLSIIECLP
jgi:hypothetical protein